MLKDNHAHILKLLQYYEVTDALLWATKTPEETCVLMCAKCP